MQAEQFRDGTPEGITDNVFRLIGKDWMLITAGPRQAYNTMTASWGGFGVIWSRQVCFALVRPARHTRRFLDRQGVYTLSFFEERYRRALEYCGAHSGRDVDKAKETGLTAVGEGQMTWFAEARLVLQCRKLYFHDLDPRNFLDPVIESHYPKKDYHRLYIGEIVRVLVK